MFENETLKKFLEITAAPTPTPGGGSVSAYVAALGAALGSMTVSFSIGKPELKEHEHRLKEAAKQLAERTERLFSLVEEDIRAYEAVTKAWTLPKNEAGQKEHRRAELQKALKYAMEVPLRGMRICLDVLKLHHELIGISNPNLISDIGTGALLTEAALNGCKMNVLVNLGLIKEDNLILQVRKEVDNLTNEAAVMKDNIMKKVLSPANK